MQKLCPWPIIVAIVLTAVVVGGGVYYWQNQNVAPVSTVKETKTVVQEEKAAEPEFKSLLFEKQGYTLPFGAAEIEGYYTTKERPTSLDGSTPDVTCSAFVITDGPSQLLDALKGDMYGVPPTAVLGSKDSNWGAINQSTKENPIKIFVSLNPTFEGEVMECMPWPFESFIEI